MQEREQLFLYWKEQLTNQNSDQEIKNSIDKLSDEEVDMILGIEKTLKVGGLPTLKQIETLAKTLKKLE